MLARLTRLLVWMALLTRVGVKAHDGLEAGRTLTTHLREAFDISDPRSERGGLSGKIPTARSLRKPSVDAEGSG